MKDRIILHCDLNNFFASVSLLFNPTLTNLPVAVCGSVEERHGIVLAKNEIAKKYGIKTASPIFEAKAKCKDLIILPPIMEKYREFSKVAHDIYYRYTDMVEPFGIDECWLDVTGSTLLFGDGEQIANRIRNDIKHELGITVSVGVSFNKIFAKLGSDMKKPDAVTVISRDNYKEKVWPLPATDLLFIGRQTGDRLKTAGINTIGDITLCPDATLKRMLGKNGLELKKYALGDDHSSVVSMSENQKPKSIGRSVTGKTDFNNFNDIWKTYLELAQSISDQLKKYKLFAGGIQVHTRTSSLVVKDFSKALPVPTDSALLIAQNGMKLLKENCRLAEPLRSVGLRVINLKDDTVGVQQDMFGITDEQNKNEKIDKSIYELRQKFGTDSIKRGTVIKKSFK